MTKFSPLNPARTVMGVKGTSLPATRNSVLGDWNAIPDNTRLYIGDVVTYNGSSYYVKLAHTKTAGTTNPASNNVEYGSYAAGGVPGTSTYIHVAYADNISGTLNFTTGAPNGRTYRGEYRDSTAADSTNPAAYTWSEYRGPGSFGLAIQTSAALSAGYIRGNNVIKTATAAAGPDWDFSAYSTEGFRGGAQTTFKVAVSGIAGLNNDPTFDASYTGIDYAWYAQAGSPNVANIFLNGAGVMSVGTWDATTVFQILYDNKKVYWLKDGIVCYSADLIPNVLLYFDSTVAFVNTGITNISFTPAGPAGVSAYAVELSTYTIDVAATSAGVTKAGQLPKNIGITVKQGSTTISSGLSYTVTTSNDTGIVASVSGTTLSVTTADAPGWVDVETTVAGVGSLGKKRLNITRTLDTAAPPTPPPATGGTGVTYPSSANTSNDYFLANTANAYGTTPQTSIMQVSTDSNGRLKVTNYFEYYVNFNSSDSTIYTYRMYAKPIYRVKGTTTWSDLAAEQLGTASKSQGQIAAGEFGETTAGTLNYAATITTLAANTDYEVSFLTRRYIGNATSIDTYSTASINRGP